MIYGIITVRTSSSRLSKKCLLPFGKDTNVIKHIIRRCKLYEIEPIVCTSIDPSDDVLIKTAHVEGVKYFRGSLINKLKRWADCCVAFGIDSFHSVDADDPFFDGELIKDSMRLLVEGYDVVCPTELSSAGAASVGYSLTSEIIRKAVELTDTDTDTEMMWHWIERVQGLKKIILPENNENPIKARLTLDYEEDYWLLCSLVNILGNTVSRKGVEKFLRDNPDFYKINWFRNEEWSDGQRAKAP